MTRTAFRSIETFCSLPHTMVVVTVQGIVESLPLQAVNWTTTLDMREDMTVGTSRLLYTLRHSTLTIGQSRRVPLHQLSPVFHHFIRLDHDKETFHAAATS